MTVDPEVHARTRRSSGLRIPAVPSRARYTTLAYFEAVERNRYLEQPWMFEHFRFSRTRGRKGARGWARPRDGPGPVWQSGRGMLWVDITDRHLELTQRNFDLRGLKVTLRKSDATQIDYADASFDLVYAFGVCTTSLSPSSCSGRFGECSGRAGNA